MVKLNVLESAGSVKALSGAVRDIRQLVVDCRKSNNSLNTNVCLFIFTLLALAEFYNDSGSMDTLWHSFVVVAGIMVP